MARPLGETLSDSGRVLRRLRRDSGLSERQLADIAGVSPATIHRIEQPGRDNRASTIGRHLDLLGADLVDFVEAHAVEFGENPPPRIESAEGAASSQTVIDALAREVEYWKGKHARAEERLEEKRARLEERKPA